MGTAYRTHPHWQSPPPPTPTPNPYHPPSALQPSLPSPALSHDSPSPPALPGPSRTPAPCHPRATPCHQEGPLLPSHRPSRLLPPQDHQVGLPGAGGGVLPCQAFLSRKYMEHPICVLLLAVLLPGSVAMLVPASFCWSLGGPICHLLWIMSQLCCTGMMLWSLHHVAHHQVLSRFHPESNALVSQPSMRVRFDSRKCVCVCSHTAVREGSQ